MSTQLASAPQCCLCGNWLQFGWKPLYGYQVCPKCHSDFAWKRAFAYLLDIVFVNVIAGIFFVIAFVVLIVLAGAAQSAHNDDAGTAAAMIFLFMYAGVFLLAFVMILVRDGFNGMSPGKRIIGLQVINTVSGVPAKFGDSFKRNLILAVPVLPLVVAIQIFTANGVRLGDEWAHTKVIWL